MMETNEQQAMQTNRSLVHLSSSKAGRGGRARKLHH
jgi:hypothetical protein